MARSTATIQQQILDNIKADTTLGPVLTSTSKRAIYNLLAFIMAVAINVLEQLIDIFTADVESVAASAAPATPAWLQNQILKFQYSGTVPQIIQFTNFAPAYPVVDATLQIISRCSVKTTLANTVLIKVATGTVPAKLSDDQLNSLKDYLLPPNGIGIAGVNYLITSGNTDQFYCQATIYYKGQYSNVVKNNVATAINGYLAALPFDGAVVISDLEGVIKAVTGVNDVVFINVSARAYGTAFSDSTPLITNQKQYTRLWNTVAGYITIETTTGYTLADSLTFTVG